MTNPSSHDFISKLASGCDARTLLPELREAARFVLQNAPEAYEEIENRYIQLTDGGMLQQDIVIALSNLQVGDADDLVDLLIECFERDAQFYELAHAFLSLTFAPDAERDHLDERQKRALVALTKNEPIWSCDGDLRTDLERLGLPPTKDEMKRLVEASPG